MSEIPVPAPTDQHRRSATALLDHTKQPTEEVAKLLAVLEEGSKPIPMRLCCEGCGTLHVDEGEFAVKPHHTHSCQECGLTWRPAIVCTVGVRFLPGYKNENS
jgi:hypothetical protein